MYQSNICNSILFEQNNPLLFPALPIKMESGNTGKGSVCPQAFLQNDWMDFLHIVYHDQVPCGADACKIELGCVPHLSNYGHIFINFEHLL